MILILKQKLQKILKNHLSEKFKKHVLQFFVIATRSLLLLPFDKKMHVLQPKHTKLKPEEVKKLLEKYNIALSQLPKIRVNDLGLPEGCVIGEVIKIERKDGEKINLYYRVVVA